MVCAQPQRAVSDIILRMVPDVFDGKEKRAVPRYPITMNATVMEIDANHESAGTAWSALTSTISEHGLGLVSSRSIKTDLLVVELPVLRRPQYLVEVVWQKKVDQFHCFGMKILEQL